MLEVGRDAAAIGEEQLAVDLPFTSWGRWQCLRGGADGLNGCSAACGCGTEYRCGALLSTPAGRVAAAVYKTRPIMPRTGATGDAGGAAGGKVRNRSTNQQPRMPREWPAPRRLLISV